MIHAIQDYYDYDLDEYKATLRSGATCPKQLQDMSAYIEQAISDKLTPEDKKWVYTVFGGEDLSVADFVGFVADTLAGAI